MSATVPVHCFSITFNTLLIIMMAVQCSILCCLNIDKLEVFLHLIARTFKRENAHFLYVMKNGVHFISVEDKYTLQRVQCRLE